VLANVTTGGNPNLQEETQRDLKLSASYDLDWFDRANIRVEYFRNQSDNTTEGFPLLTPAIEAAFPGRVTRAADGTLLSIDRRPVTFAERNSSRIRYGINLFGKVGKPRPQSEESGGAGRGGFRGAMAAAEPAQPATPPIDPSAGGGSFDPARFAQMRAQFCTSPAGTMPDLSGLPERMAERLKGPDGQIDPAKVAEARTRMCNADGTPRTDAGGRTFDPARFAALRTALNCGAEGQPVDPATLPPEIADRLKGPDGTIEPARLAELRTRLCALPADGSGGSGRRGGQGGGEGGSGGDGARGSGAGDGGRSGGGSGGDGARGSGAGAGGRSGGGSGGSPFGRGGGGDDGQGRWNLSLYHTVELTNRALIADGGPALDLLQGDGLSDGGVPRHRIELEGGVFKDGLGARVSANYQSGTTVRGSGLPGSSDLRFGQLATVNLNLFANLEQQDWLTGGGEPGFWKGTRLSLRVRNLFDAQQRVTDADGLVPLRYQPALVDPTGRTVGIEFRKMF
jgi:iron complex outermembrane recepter protein